MRTGMRTMSHESTRGEAVLWLAPSDGRPRDTEQHHFDAGQQHHETAERLGHSIGSGCTFTITLALA
jgi:hypothetical protein